MLITIDGEAAVALTIYGVVVLAFMMGMYALEGRHVRFIAAFAVGCVLSSAYGFLSGAWPFGVVEAIWCVVAGRRYVMARGGGGRRSATPQGPVHDPPASSPGRGNA